MRSVSVTPATAKSQSREYREAVRDTGPGGKGSGPCSSGLNPVSTGKPFATGESFAAWAARVNGLNPVSTGKPFATQCSRCGCESTDLESQSREYREAVRDVIGVSASRGRYTESQSREYREAVRDILEKRGLATFAARVSTWISGEFRARRRPRCLNTTRQPLENKARREQ